MNDMSSYAHRFRRLAAITLRLTLLTGIATVIPQSRALLVNRPYCASLYRTYLPHGEYDYRFNYKLGLMWESLHTATRTIEIPHDPRVDTVYEAILLSHAIGTPNYDIDEISTVWDKFCRVGDYFIFRVDDEYGPLHY